MLHFRVFNERKTQWQGRIKILNELQFFSNSVFTTQIKRHNPPFIKPVRGWTGDLAARTVEWKVPGTPRRTNLSARKKGSDRTRAVES